MSTCTRCGQPGAAGARFCSSCGAPFPAAAGEEPALAQQEAWDAQQDTLPGLQDSLPGQPEAWSARQTVPTQPGAAVATESPGDSLGYLFGDSPGETARQGGELPGRQAGPAGGAPGAAAPPYPGPGPVYRQPRGRRRPTAVTLVAGIILVLAAGALGAWAVLGGNGHPSAGTSHGTRPASTAHGSSARPSSSAPSTTPRPSPSSSGQVAVAPTVARQGSEPKVVAFLNRYFTAINHHNYQQYYGLLDAQQQQQTPESQFRSGYRATRDSGATLVALGPAGGGIVAASITFTSHQPAADSPSQSSCTDWSTTLYLRPQGGSYVIGAPPPTYHAAYHAC